jgi:hypothetical protein
MLLRWVLICPGNTKDQISIRLVIDDEEDVHVVVRFT